MSKFLKISRICFFCFFILILYYGYSFGLDFVFKDPQYSFQALRAISMAPSGAADIGEIMITLSKIEEGNDESWYREWYNLANQRETTAKDFENRGKIISAKYEYYKASNYYRTAEFFLHTNINDTRIVPTWKSSKDCFLKGIKYENHFVEEIKIPFEDSYLPGYFGRVDQTKIKRPLLIIQTGFDGTKEEIYMGIARSAIERGYNVLVFEGPGQGEVIRLQGIPFRYNWETVLTPVVDYAVKLKEVDLKKIAVMGISFGGYLVPRAVAFEKRVAAMIANGGIYDFHASAKLPPQLDANLDNDDVAKEIDQYLYAQMKTNPSTRWAMSNALFTFNLEKPSDWLRATRKYTMKDIANKISCTTLIVDSEEDKDLPGQSMQLYDALTCKKEYLLFKAYEGAGEHCQIGASIISNNRILDWLDEVLK